MTTATPSAATPTIATATTAASTDLPVPMEANTVSEGAAPPNPMPIPQSQNNPATATTTQPPTSQLKETWDLLQIIQPDKDLINPTDWKIKVDILRIILQYLQDEGYYAASMTIMDSVNLKAFERLDNQADIRRMRKAILEGDWPEVDRICTKPFMRNHHKSFLYSAYEQQYLEYIEHHEIQKAFTHLNKRLKPLEHLQRTPNEFRDLCYLLTSKSVQDVPSFKNWEGIGPSREKLCETFQSMIDYDVADREGSTFVPPSRLLTLLRQAVAYQVECSRYHTSAPKITTLLHDFTALIVPNAVKATYVGHTASVKCARFIGEAGVTLISGGGDNAVRIWETETAECLAVLTGHTSRIWDVASRSDGHFAASASGDTTVKLWDLRKSNVSSGSSSSSPHLEGGNVGGGGGGVSSVASSTFPCVSTLRGSDGDVYSVQYHPTGDYIVTGGYDKVVRLYDVERETITKTFSGHGLSISRAIFTPLGNLIVSGSKDNTIKFWDIVSGLCIKTISSHLGEVSSLDLSGDGCYLLSGSKDNSNRLWDVRMLRPIMKFKGHQNTSKNFIRSSFAGGGGGESLVVGGSEDGIVYVWDREKGTVLRRLRHHKGMVYNMTWNAKQALFLSCSEDGTLASWIFRQPSSIPTPP